MFYAFHLEALRIRRRVFNYEMKQRHYQHCSFLAYGPGMQKWVMCLFIGNCTGIVFFMDIKRIAFPAVKREYGLRIHDKCHSIVINGKSTEDNMLTKAGDCLGKGNPTTGLSVKLAFL